MKLKIQINCVSTIVICRYSVYEMKEMNKLTTNLVYLFVQRNIVKLSCNTVPFTPTKRLAL